MANIYDANATMKLIGNQTLAVKLASYGGTAYTEFKEVMDAHLQNKTVNATRDEMFNVAIDFFTLGAIYGKRLERERKKQQMKCTEQQPVK